MGISFILSKLDVPWGDSAVWPMMNMCHEPISVSKDDNSGHITTSPSLEYQPRIPVEQTHGWAGIGPVCQVRHCISAIGCIALHRLRRV